MTARIANVALELGFARVGFAPVGRFSAAAEKLRSWLAQGYHGDLSYLAGDSDRADPAALLPEAKTIVAVALSYARPSTHGPLRTHGGALTGSIARYAQGEDYHLVMKQKLNRLAAEIETQAGRPVASRMCVDTAPLLEHESARAAGLGFSAKSTLTIVPGLGSYVLLGELLIDLELEPSTELRAGCGSCRACIDACPTSAFVGPHVLDARRCIAYLTIEQQGSIPRALRAPIGTRVFGCDVCQEVCPFNASSAPKPHAPELAPRPALAVVDLVALLELGAAGYRRLVRRTALRRVPRDSLARNAAVALGNTHDPRAAAPLARALGSHRSELVREHAAWALGELGSAGGDLALGALQAAAAGDPSAAVRAEAADALARLATEGRAGSVEAPAKDSYTGPTS